MNSRSPGSRPSLWLAFSALLRADLAVLIKNRRALLLSILLPIIVLALGSSSRESHHIGGPLSVIGLAIALGLISTSILGYALTIASDREQGVFQRLRVTPTPVWAIMTSRLTTQALANVLLALAVVIVGSVIHHLSITPGEYALVLLVSVLAGAVFLSIGQALVGLMKSADSVNAAARAVVVGLILLAAFGQRGSLGTTGGSITRWSPVGAVMTLFAAVLNTPAWDTRDSLSLLACAGYMLVFAAIGIKWFRWDAR